MNKVTGEKTRAGRVVDLLTHYLTLFVTNQIIKRCCVALADARLTRDAELGTWGVPTELGNVKLSLNPWINFQPKEIDTRVSVLRCRR